LDSGDDSFILTGGAQAQVKLGAIGSGWVATEAVCEWLGGGVGVGGGYMDYGKEVIAGGVTGAFFAAWSASSLSIPSTTTDTVQIDLGCAVAGARCCLDWRAGALSGACARLRGR
jgi:hypothetical protein